MLRPKIELYCYSYYICMHIPTVYVPRLRVGNHIIDVEAATWFDPLMISRFGISCSTLDLGRYIGTEVISTSS